MLEWNCQLGHETAVTGDRGFGGCEASYNRNLLGGGGASGWNKEPALRDGGADDKFPLEMLGTALFARGQDHAGEASQCQRLLGLDVYLEDLGTNSQLSSATYSMANMESTSVSGPFVLPHLTKDLSDTAPNIVLCEAHVLKYGGAATPNRLAH